jgi:hypothetical protein
MNVVINGKKNGSLSLCSWSEETVQLILFYERGINDHYVSAKLQMHRYSLLQHFTTLQLQLQLSHTINDFALMVAQYIRTLSVLNIFRQ